ncbi:glycosyltransferase [Marinobacter hydrocarbonoclasticus]|nr:glycosyltransferase [Marinobacter nauticus]
MLAKTLEAYLEAGVDQLVVVDNASEDDTPALLSARLVELGKRLVVLRQDQNLGAAGGFHLGMSFVRDNGDTDWLVVSDDDSYPAPDCLDRFRRAVTSQHAKANLIAARVTFPAGDICPMNRPMAFPQWRTLMANLFTGHRVTSLPEDPDETNQCQKVMAASFVGLFIRRDALLRTGVLPDPDYFLYWDDIGFCLDMGKHKEAILFHGGLNFVHDCGRHSSNLAGERFYLMVRNGYRVMAKMPLGYRLMALPYKSLCWLIQSMKRRAFHLFLKAIRDI